MQHSTRVLAPLLLAAWPVAAGPIGLSSTTRSGQPKEVAANIELAPARVVATGERHHRYYAQQIDGAPVLGCGVDEIVGADGSSQIQSSRFCATQASAAAVVVSAEAETIARAAIGQAHPAERMVVAPPQSAYRPTGAPVWMVDAATSNPWGVHRVFLDATNGNVLRIASLAHQKRGRVFGSVDDAERKRGATRRLRDLDGSGLLSGADVLVDDTSDFLALCDTTSQYFCTPPGSTACAAQAKGGGFHYSPKAPVQIGSCTINDRFDQVTGYYHLAEMANYFRNLGWEMGSGALAGHLPLPVLTNVPYFANAYFAPPSSVWPAHMAFGDESTGMQLNDLTNDPTIPRHEFTHAMVHDTAGGINDADICISDCSPYAGAMNEGFADYFAVQSLGGKQTLVLSQAGDFLADAVRDIDNDLRFPCDLTGSVHDDGRIWSGFLRDAKSVFGKPFDAAVARSIAHIPHGLGYGLGFGEAFEAILDELPAMTEKQKIALVQHGTRRGVLGAFAKDRGGSVSIDEGDAAWICEPGATCDVATATTGGFSSASIGLSALFPGGLAASVQFDVTAPLDLRGKQVLHVQIWSEPVAGAGELSLVFDDDLDCRSPIQTISLPALGAGWNDRYLQFSGSDTLGRVTCVGLRAPAGARTVLIDAIDTGVSRFGPVVVPINASDRLALKNDFPLPHGDSHFYYFIPPSSASTVTIRAQAKNVKDTDPGLTFCGAVQVVGQGKVKPEISTMHLWQYDPSQTTLPIQLTLLPLDSHTLISGIPARNATTRLAKKVALPPSPTGVFAVSLNGSGDYTIKLSFQ